MYAVLAVLGVCAFASAAAYEEVFTYIKPDFFRRAGEDDCKVCYGDNDCITLNQARCEFYSAASEILYEDDGPTVSSNPEVTVKVDSLMADLAEQSSHLLEFQECVPFLSQYTDCTKENICFGCRTCTCTEFSKWNCSDVQLCRPEVQMVVDHRALVMTVETLRGDETPSIKLKRSISNTPKPRNVTFEDLAEWMYEAKPLNIDILSTVTDAYLDPNDYLSTTEAAGADETSKAEVDDLTAVRDTTTSTTNLEPDNTSIAFDDVLNSIFVQNANYSRRKTLKMSQSDTDFDHDYVKFNNPNVTFNEISNIQMADRFVNLLKALEEEETPQEVTTTEGVTKVVIDLLELAKKRLESTGNDLNRTNSKVTLHNDTMFDETDNIEFNAINIMKRDVSQVTEENLNLTVTETIDSDINQNLETSVYLPINTIIQDKQKELEDLLHVKDKLIEILNLDRNNEYVQKPKNRTNSYMNFYNVQIMPQTELDYRRSNTNHLDQHMNKLRRDIYVVIKDIINIQRITGRHNLPNDLKILTRAIKYFMLNHTKSHKNQTLRTFENIFNFRRYNEDNSNMTKDLVKNCLINILLSIDKVSRVQYDPLAPLSIKTRKIVKRVIKNQKLDEYSVIGLRINDPHYNLTNDLKSIGVHWQDMTFKISNSTPWDRLHRMKMLQYVLESDIVKMKDALALINFAYSRRMVAIDDDVNKEELLRINNNLKFIHNKIHEIKKLPLMKSLGSRVVKILTISKQGKKDTFLKHIKNLLKSSKRDVVRLLRKKVPKSDIIKKMAKKKLDELTKQRRLLEYENVMQRWQNQLDITRKKRSFPFEKHNMRTKNILPKYLRGKVSSGINSTKHKTKPKHLERIRSKKSKPKSTSKSDTSRRPKTTAAKSNTTLQLSSKTTTSKSATTHVH